ncbi:TerB family tellurite resistance protein [Flavobacteriaceae bacterium]|nr:TerB family tellurite resistance protein [Flavobacteriaceae bacterium]
MKNYANWIGAGIGWAAGGPIGAALGYLIGNVIKGSSKDYKEFSQEKNKTNTEPGDFEISLLFLSAVVIKADGKIDQKELDHVRDYFVKMYGKDRANHAFKLFKEIINNKSISTKEICTQIRSNMSHASRLQLVHYLFSIAKADGTVTEDEVKAINTIANYLYISHPDFESIKAMFYNSTDNAYKILEVEKTDDMATIKKSYRSLVKKHHPDKVAQLGEEHMKGAQEKFLKIQEAYEAIKKERNA